MARTGRFRWLTDRLAVWDQLFRHGGRAVIGLALGWFLTLLLLVRDNVLSEQDRDALQFSKFIPRLSVSEWLTVAVVLLFLFMLEGAYRFIHKERMSATEEMARLMTQIQKLEAEKHTPKFVGTIKQTTTGQPQPITGPLPANGGTDVIVTMSILNKGAPSIAQNYRAAAIVNGARHAAEIWYFNKINLSWANGVNLAATEADAIYEKTQTIRIDTGSQVQGVLYLKVPGVTKESFAVPGNGIEVLFDDFADTTYTARHVFDADSGGITKYYPGGPRPVSPMPKSGKRKRK
jgi:hypothetical protein